MMQNTRMNIIQDTQRLIRESDMTQGEICKKAKVSQRWMQNFLHDKMKDPGILRVTRLREVLSNSQFT